MSTTPRPLIRLVIKEELVILTGDHISALCLQQFIYWSERTRDVDKFIQEEKKRMHMNKEDLKVDLQKGWIYKTAKELSQELLSIVKEKTIERRLDDLVDKGWLHRRNHPKYKWDRTYQYRVDIIKIQQDLQALGYSLENYPLFQPNVNESDANVTETDAEDNETNQGDNVTGQEDTGTNQDDKKSGQDVTVSNQSANNVGAIPEITSEIFSRDYTSEIFSDTTSEHTYFEQVKKTLFQTNVNNKLVPVIVNKLKEKKVFGLHRTIIVKALEEVPAVVEQYQNTGKVISDPAEFVAEFLLQKAAGQEGAAPPSTNNIKRPQYNWLEQQG